MRRVLRVGLVFIAFGRAIAILAILVMASASPSHARGRVCGHAPPPARQLVPSSTSVVPVGERAPLSPLAAYGLLLMVLSLPAGLVGVCLEQTRRVRVSSAKE